MKAKSDSRELTSYSEDFLLWSDEQAELRRRRARARPEAFAGLDIDNLAQEIADWGGSELRATESFLIKFFLHLIKIASDPASRSLDRWWVEVQRFRIDFQVSYLPSMRQRIDLEALWQKARRLVRQDLDPYQRTIGAGVPERCPFTLDELLEADLDRDEAVARLGGPNPRRR